MKTSIFVFVTVLLLGTTPFAQAKTCFCVDKEPDPTTCTVFATLNNTCKGSNERKTFCPANYQVWGYDNAKKSRDLRIWNQCKNAQAAVAINNSPSVTSGTKTAIDCYCKSTTGSCTHFVTFKASCGDERETYSCTDIASNADGCSNKGSKMDYTARVVSQNASSSTSLTHQDAEKFKNDVNKSAEQAKEKLKNDKKAKNEALATDMSERWTNKDLNDYEKSAKPDSGFKDVRIKKNLQGKSSEELGYIQDAAGKIKDDKKSLRNEVADGSVVNNQNAKSDYKTVVNNSNQISKNNRTIAENELKINSGTLTDEQKLELSEQNKQLQAQNSTLDTENKGIYEARGVQENGEKSKNEQVRVSEYWQLDSEKRQAAKTERKAKRMGRKVAEQEQMGELLREENTTNSYCGTYNTKNCEATKLIQDSLKVTAQITNQAVTAAAQIQSTGRVTDLATQGSQATTQDMVTAQQGILRDTAKMNNYMGYLHDASAAYQAFRGFQHRKSASKVIKAGEGELKKIEEEKEELTAISKQYETQIEAKNSEINLNQQEINVIQVQMDGLPADDPERLELQKEFRVKTNALNTQKAYVSALEKEQEKVATDLAIRTQERSNVMKNMTQEARQQRETSESVWVTAAASLQQGAANHMNASMLNNQANALTPMGPSNGSLNEYTLNPTLPGNEAENSFAPGTGPSEGLAMTDTSNEPADDATGGFGDYNPNFNNDQVAGAAPGEFKSSDPNSGGGGGGSASAGGTSAARDGGSGGPASEGGKGKLQAGGSFADGGGSGAGRRGLGPRSASVDKDSDIGFGDLLKKFLPGGEEDKKKKDAMGLDSDRSPASDRAAVIGRNQNIFIEISKRYKKKNSEGAVVFQ